jgi:hypothetical protein
MKNKANNNRPGTGAKAHIESSPYYGQYTGAKAHIESSPYYGQ